MNKDDLATGNGRATNATIQAEIMALRERLDLIWTNHEREHAAHDRAHTLEHVASQKAIDTAAELAKENKADANEWRASMTDREGRFSTKDDINGILTRLDSIERAALLAAEREASRIKEAAHDLDEAQRRQARSQWTIALVVGVLATGGAVMMNVILRLSGV
jgi:hypothetical protein